MASVFSSLVPKYELLCKREKWKKLGAVGFNFRRDGFSCGLEQHLSAELEIKIDMKPRGIVVIVSRRAQSTPGGSTLEGIKNVHSVSEALYRDKEEEKHEESDEEESIQNEKLDTELLEAYLAYCKSIGHEPNIKINDAEDEDDSEAGKVAAAYIPERPAVPEHKHFWTDFIGTRYSKRRGCVQFWAWLGIGVGVVMWLGFSLSSLHLNEVLHLDAFTEQNVQVTQDYTYLHLLEEVDFHLTYTIETPRPNANANPNSSYFNALLLDEDEYEHYVNGEPFEYIQEGSTLRTTYAYLPRTYIENRIEESMYFVIQPCYLARDPTSDYCQTSQLPSSVDSDEKIFDLDKQGKPSDRAAWEHFNVTYISVNPMPVACSSSGIVGGAYLLLFLPYVIITLFGLRVFQMITHCESFQKNIERIYARELNVPEDEVDYWQPMPWDRKVPKTRLCGPCCWKKFRRPFEPFYTWWRHENYFTWVFCPYRNEQLSRGERALIVVCSLYITFYVLFIIVMLRDSWGADITIFTSVVLYAIMVSVLPAAGKAIFKELFKLIFRQRRKYFRAKAAGGDLSGFSFRLAFILQIFVVVLLTLAQGPIFYIWAYRSCLFLKQFIYYGVLAAIARMSLMGLMQDLAWYAIIKTWGWKDLCPYCTERIKHCDCFNDEVLVLAVQHVGPKWELIRVLDTLLAKQNSYEPQFALYTSEQLRERWDVIVDRAEKHMDKVEKLRAYREKKRQEALRHDPIRRSFTSFISFHGTTQAVHPDAEENENDKKRRHSDATSEEEAYKDSFDSEDQLCNLREKKILALNSKIQLDEFEKHYDSSISDVFHALARSVTKRRHHDKHEHGDDSEHEEDTDKHSPRSTFTTRQSSDSSDGETMWVFDTPAQRLERREEEKLQRKRAFRVLKDYNIESVGASSEPTSAPSALSPSGPQLRRQDTRRIPLIPSRNKPETPREEDFVILMPDEHSKSDRNNKDNLDTVANARVEGDNDDQQDSDYFPSDLERGHSRSASSSQAVGGNRVYAVTERRKTLLRRVSTSAEAFAAWALDYDPKAAQQL
ncbi:uncharacterized protein PITG_15058 [Phytophthora infestans T30-4]|uniref:Transmembrane protein, putative n=1 Tax=Phytophthora infestans (strain T30-4) TaxID=403677 RepID=D0NRJ9_PHYIT|nr:uncharacterized protein PITG_15058 [Phytophthora infestans T30-4]EEY63349.1 transmembrane protein, putative [Phytophthora infestans T30-4]|eukprot:XP_002898234.1 transmembrane protein, putative [Phytophthora infestans T30-4]